MRTGGPKDPTSGPKPIPDEERRVERTRRVKKEKDLYDLKRHNVDERQQRLELLAAPKKGRGALVAQVLTRAQHQLDKLKEEIDAVLQLLAEADFGVAVIGRQAKKLDRLRQRREDTSRRHRAQVRALWEAQVGLTELANGSTSPRRIVLRGKDRATTFEEAISANPTTLFLDAPFAVLGSEK